MTINEIKDAVKNAVQEFERQDAHLLDVNTSERSMTHALAIKLMTQKIFLEWNVDCEYNRNFDDIKKLDLPVENSQSNDICAKTIYPDIVVHRRGTDNNLLVIEAKKTGGDVTKDRQKIQAYIEQLGYQFGVILTFPQDIQKECTYEWWHRTNDGKARGC